MKRVLLALTTAALLTAGPVFSQTIGSIEGIQDGAQKLVDTLVTGLPFNSTVGLNWSDAYIGPFLAIPPNLGVGVTLGTTTVDAGDITDLLTNFGVDVGDVPEMLPLPAAVAEARIGGFVFPFDIGVKAGFIPESVGESLADGTGGLNVEYLLVGADVRYALLKGSLLLPKVSVGVGFNYMKGGLNKKLGTDQTYVYHDGYNGDDYTISATAPDVGLTWETTVFDLKVQVSKSLIIFTPYLGLGASYGKTTAGYSIDSDVVYEKNGVVLADSSDLEDALSAAGIEVPELSSTGISYENEGSGWGLRAFGGLSVNMLIVRLDATGMYNVADGNLGASIGVRIQL